MNVQTAELMRKHCTSCEGHVAALSPEECAPFLEVLPEWRLAGNGERIRRDWRVNNFETALKFFGDVGRIAEEEDHHPDLHLTGYRNVTIELSTHAVQGLTENDFILAAKIDQIPVELKK